MNALNSNAIEFSAESPRLRTKVTSAMGMEK